MAEGGSGVMGDIEPEETSPSLRDISPLNSPDLLRGAAETGVISAVELHTEGIEDGDSQDAARLTEEVKSAIAPSIKVAPTNDKQYRVLIIEDTPELAKVIRETLNQMNMDTAHETYSNRAIEYLKKMKPDIVLLDLGLPDMIGWQIMDVIKADQKIRGEMPIIIVITAYDNPTNYLVGQLQDVQGYLIKPLTPDKIQKTIIQAISSSMPG